MELLFCTVNTKIISGGNIGENLALDKEVLAHPENQRKKN
jgi:hypothetical protein